MVSRHCATSRGWQWKRTESTPASGVSGVASGGDVPKLAPTDTE